MRLGRIQHVHLVGIGGSGMSGLAEVLVREGFRVSGSDQQSNETTLRLQYLGCTVYVGHSKENIEGADVLVYSTAVPERNPERVAAEELGIPCIRRGEMLAELMRLKVGVAIAGAHGKTTTTTMSGFILDSAGFDPTVVVGGRILGVDGNTIPGRSEFLVAEADESDGSFLLLSPAFCVVTNLDEEHLDHYGSYAAVEDSFVQFVNHLPFWGAAILCCDDPKLSKLFPRMNRAIRTYGFGEEADVRGVVLSTSIDGTQMRVFNEELEFDVFVPVAGRHNASNALGAIALALELGAQVGQIREGLERFQGIHRRLELRHKDSQRRLYDDYAHHPTEIRATISTIVEQADSAVDVVFQPHRYTRTRDCWGEFLGCFEGVRNLWIMPIYAAGESEIEGISSERLVAELKERNPDVEVALFEEQNIKQVVDHWEDSILLTLGAGSITSLSKDLIRVLGEATE